VSNGDNDYDPSFLSVLAEQHGAEVVAFDYYSRFQRPTGQSVPSAPTYCQTPLLHRLLLRLVAGVEVWLAGHAHLLPTRQWLIIYWQSHSRLRSCTPPRYATSSLAAASVHQPTS
jgi:hypothetical protein